MSHSFVTSLSCCLGLQIGVVSPSGPLTSAVYLCARVPPSLDGMSGLVSGKSSRLLAAASLAPTSAFSLPSFPTCARTLYMCTSPWRSVMACPNYFKVGG
eukprot:1189591-Prorocentrum_minimum.AAC.2